MAHAGATRPTRGRPRFVADQTIAQQGFASAEPYQYEHVFEEYGKAVAFELLHDAGFQVYSQTIGIRPGDLEDLRGCLELIVPVIQQSVVDYDAAPERANAMIVDAVTQFEDFWVYDMDLAAFSVQAQRDLGLVGNGPDGIVGNMDADRIQTVIDKIAVAGMDFEAGLSVSDIMTNEFIDTSISFPEYETAAPEIAFDFGVTEDVIRVGAIADLSGIFAPLVIQIIDAQTAYWDMVNENGGIGGRQIEFVVLDNAYDVPTHLERYEVMRDEDEGVVFLSQSTGSPHTAAIAEALVEDGLGAIPLSWYSGWPDPDFGQNVFESYTNYCYESINGVDYMANNIVDGEARLAVISFPGEYGQDGAVGAKIAAEALGIEVVYDGEGAVIPGADQTPVITGLLESGANMVWATISPSIFAEIFGGAGAQGFTAQWSGNSPTYNYMLLATPLAPLLDALYTQSTYTLTWNTGDAPGMTDMVAELQARIPDKPLSDVYTVGWTEAMATHQILEAAAAAGDLTRAGVIAAANSTTVDYGGLAPSQSYGGDINDYIVRESYMFDIQADLFDVAATVAGGGSTGSVLIGDGPIVSDITKDQTYEGACFVAG